MLKLSWDLFVVVIFTVIIAYSFIIGKDATLKIIIGSYIAILASDGLGNLIREYLIPSKGFLQFLKLIGIAGEDKAIIFFKVAFFILVIVVITMIGGFEVKSMFGKTGILGAITNLVFGFLSAGLVVSTLLIYVSGASFVAGNLSITNNALANAYAESKLVKTMIDNYNLWFALPAVAFVITSLFGKKQEQLS